MLGESFILWAQELIVEFSYIAVFIVSTLSTSTILVPFPIYVVIFFAAGLGLHPLIVGVIAGLGSAVGEMFGYMIGLGGRYVAEGKATKSSLKAEKKNLEKTKTPKFVKKFESLFQKYGFWVIMLTAFLPFPFDFIGMLSGASKYDIKKFYIGVSIGKIAKCLLIAYAGYIAIPYLRLFLVGA